MQIGDGFDLRALGRDQMQILAKQIGDDTHILDRARLAERALSRHRESDHIGLRQARCHHPAVDREHIGNRALGRPGGDDEARRSANIRRLTASHTGRMTQELRQHRTDGEIGSGRGACGNLEGDPLRIVGDLGRCREGKHEGHAKSYKRSGRKAPRELVSSLAWFCIEHTYYGWNWT